MWLPCLWTVVQHGASPRAFPRGRADPELLFDDALLTKTKLKRERAEVFDVGPAFLHVLA